MEERSGMREVNTNRHSMIEGKREQETCLSASNFYVFGNIKFLSTASSAQQ